MSWKQVIVMVGIWLSVTVASESRSHLDLNSNFQQLNGQCPYGYVLKEGDVPGSGLSFETVEATIADCSNRCNNKPNCCSFEYSQTEKKCNLNTGCTSTTGQGSLPWLFCTKGITTDNTVQGLFWYDPANFLKLKDDKAIIFMVRANIDASIWFSTSDNHTGEDPFDKSVYHIGIGGYGNTKSAIDRYGSRKILKLTPRLLNSIEDRPFWADAKGGLVRLGKGLTIGSEIVMEWQDSNPVDPNYVVFSTGTGSTGFWKVKQGKLGVIPNTEKKALQWVEEIRGRMSQKIQGYNQKLIAFGSSMSEKLEEFTNALELNDGAVEVIEKICSKKGVAHIGKVIKCDRNCGTFALTHINGEHYIYTITCSSTSCSLHCNQVSSCQAMLAHESTWMIECSETSTCQRLNATCTGGKTCFAKCSGTSSCQGAVWTGNWLVECSGPSSC